MAFLAMSSLGMFLKIMTSAETFYHNLTWFTVLLLLYVNKDVVEVMVNTQLLERAWKATEL